MISKILILALVAVAVADKRPSYSYGAPQQNSFEHDSDESFEPAEYNFQFAVKDSYSGSDFQHQEARDDENTKGSYTVQLPDGRLQKVTYYVDGDSGFVADVSYQGEARYPDSDESREYSAPRPSYSAPRPAAPRPSYSAPSPTYGVPQ